MKSFGGSKIKLVYSLGGSILAKLDAPGLQTFAAELKEIASEHTIYLVVGGGRIARDYIGKARALGADESFCDHLGIAATRMNAMLLSAALGCTPDIPDSYHKAWLMAKTEGIAVMGGLYPGQTTDAVSAMLAEYVHADRLVIATSVDGVYSSDPEIDIDAKKISKMDANELVEMAMGTKMKAGSRSPVDPLAAKIIERSNIPTSVVLGSEVANLKRAYLGTHTGTEIVVMRA